MVEVKKGYKLQKKIKDSKFNIENLHNYHLSLQLGKRDFQICIINRENNRVLLLEDYIFREDYPIDEKLQILAHIWDNHHLLMAAFWKSIRFNSKSQKFSLVPSQVFLKESMTDYLRLNCSLDLEKENVYYYKLTKGSVISVFSEPKAIKDFLSGYYPNKEIEFVHNSSAMIEGILQTQQARPKEKKLYLFIDRFYINIIGTQGKKLEFYNQFKVKSFDDYLKYSLSVMKGMEMDPAQEPIKMWGHIRKNSQHFSALQKQIPHISFGERPAQLTFSHAFDEVQEHQYFDVFSSYFCT